MLTGVHHFLACSVAMPQFSLWKFMDKPVSRFPMYVFMKKFMLSNPLKVSGPIMRLGESAIFKNILARSFVTPQQESVIELDKLSVSKFAGKRVSKDNKYAIIYLHGGAFVLRFPTLYKYFSDYLNNLTGIPVCRLVA